eukprot:2138640-Pyramimonas_sp.AAC.1
MQGLNNVFVLRGPRFTLGRQQGPDNIKTNPGHGLGLLSAFGRCNLPVPLRGALKKTRQQCRRCSRELDGPAE